MYQNGFWLFVRKGHPFYYYNINLMPLLSHPSKVSHFVNIFKKYMIIFFPTCEKCDFLKCQVYFEPLCITLLENCPDCQDFFQTFITVYSVCNYVKNRTWIDDFIRPIASQPGYFFFLSANKSKCFCDGNMVQIIHFHTVIVPLWMKMDRRSSRKWGPTVHDAFLS